MYSPDNIRRTYVTKLDSIDNNNNTFSNKPLLFEITT